MNTTKSESMQSQGSWADIFNQFLAGESLLT